MGRLWSVLQVIRTFPCAACCSSLVARVRAFSRRWFGPSQGLWGSSGYRRGCPATSFIELCSRYPEVAQILVHFLFGGQGQRRIFVFTSLWSRVNHRSVQVTQIFGWLHVCETSRPADRQTYGQRPTGRGTHTEANRQTLTDTNSLVESVCSILPELVQENGL